MSRRRPATDVLRERFCREPDVVAAPSQFGHEEAFWVNGKEVAHFEADAVEVRVTRQVVSAERAALKADPGVLLRRSTSDWIELRLDDDGAVERATRWFLVAVERHRAAAGTLPKPPPSARELARRRSFH